jgi:hypothetical protein
LAENELDVIRRLKRGEWKRDELTALYDQYRDRYRVLLHLIQHPRFPDALALSILSRLFAFDLLMVIRNTRTNPFIRKRAEIEFKIRYPRIPLGEKISLLRTAPCSLLSHFIDENESLVIQAILGNPNCTEEILLRFIRRPGERSVFYRAIDATDRHRSATVSLAIARDPEAPVKMLLKIIPFVGLAELKRMAGDETLHQIVRARVREYLQGKLKARR